MSAQINGAHRRKIEFLSKSFICFLMVTGYSWFSYLRCSEMWGYKQAQFEIILLFCWNCLSKVHFNSDTLPQYTTSQSQKQLWKTACFSSYSMCSRGNQIKSMYSTQYVQWSHPLLWIQTLKMHLLYVVGHFVWRDGTLPWYLHWTCVNTRRFISKWKCHAWNTVV